MKIGKSIDYPPPRELSSKSKYAALWAEAKKLPTGKWLPVVCDNENDFRRIRTSALGRGDFEVQSNSKTLTVYLQRRLP